jgi:hypothetical protein
MFELVANCPRCGAKQMTFNVIAHHFRGTNKSNGQPWYEAFSICRNCNKPTSFVLTKTSYDESDPLHSGDGLGPRFSLNNDFTVESFVSLKDLHHAQAPEHVPENIKAVFDEGATCLTVQCFNAASTMFRLCVDMATRELLPPHGTTGLNDHTRRNLGPRITWLLDNRLLPEALREISTCIREDGNDGAHAGTLTKEDAENLLDFTTILLERLYTEPEELKRAQRRRDKRRTPPSTPAGAAAAPAATS